MITAVDTNILLDVLIPDAPHAAESEQALTDALERGAVIISEAVYAELSVGFNDAAAMNRFLESTGLRLQSSRSEALYCAGEAWREYSRRRSRATCLECGTEIPSRQHVLADFLIGAHASVMAQRLLTRDRGLYASYFPELPLS